MCVLFAHMMRIPKIPCFFVPKYRRKALYGECPKTLCRRKGTGTVEADIYPNHIHLLSEIPPEYSASPVRECSKARVVCRYMSGEETARYKHRGRQFWCKGYYVDTTGKNAQKIAGIYTKSTTGRRRAKSVDNELCPVYGRQVK